MASLKSCLLFLGTTALALVPGVRFDNRTIGPDNSANDGNLNAPATKSCPYEVQLGDYCYLIAVTKFNITLDQFMALNPEKTANCPLEPKEIVQVPCVEEKPTPKPDTASPCIQEYTVHSGDSCLEISLLKGVSIVNLRGWNDLNSSCDIQLGQKLCVSKTKPVQCKSFHEVIPDDNCHDIASKNYVTLDDLARWNPALLDVECSINPGHKICVAGEDDSSTEPDDMVTTATPIQSSSAATELTTAKSTLSSSATANLTTATSIQSSSATAKSTTTHEKATSTTSTSAIATTTSKSKAEESTKPSGMIVTTISPELRAEIRLSMTVYVGNLTSLAKPRDDVLGPSAARIEQVMKKSSVKNKHAIKATEVPEPKVQWIKLLLSTHVNIEVKSCVEAGPCSLVASVNYQSSPAASQGNASLSANHPAGDASLSANLPAGDASLAKNRQWSPAAPAPQKKTGHC